MVGRHRTTDPSSGQHRFSGRARRRMPATLLAHSKLTASVVVLLLAASVTSVVLTQSTSPVAAAQATCTPDAGYGQCVQFTNSGTDQSFTLPLGTDGTNVLVKAWGGGGGANNIPALGGYSSGGAGGYVSGVVSAAPGSVFSVVVGGGGLPDGATPVPAYGFGGAGTGALAGSGGGGLSGLFTGSATVAATDKARAVLVAGGGGSGDTNACGSCFSLGGQGGGSFSGGQPTMQGQGNTFVSGSGNGGSAGGGYAGGIANQTRLQGANIDMAEGGSNYIGGAPGATVSSGVTAAAAEYTTANIPANDGRVPPHSTEPQYVSGIGIGATLNVAAQQSAGGNGLVVFEYNLLPTVTIRKITTGGVGTFNFTGTNGIPATPLTTTVAGTAVSSSVKTLSASSTATTITEAATAGFTLAASATPCTGLGSGGTATLNATTGVLTLDAAATAANAVIVCTFTNALTSDLSITKTDNVTNVTGAQALVYTAVITNNGPNTVTSALLKDALPNGLASFSSITCAVASGTATCPTTMTQALITGAGITIPSMAANSSLRFLISGTTSATLLANVVNTATVTPPAGIVNSGTSCVSPAVFTSGTGICAATDTDVPVQPDLSITKTDSTGSYLLGTPVTYQTTVTNTGDGPGSTVVTETIPTNTTYTGLNEGWTFINTTQATQTVNVAAGASVPVKFTVTVDDPPAFNTRAIVNNVTTSEGTCIPCSVSHPTPTPGVTLTKTASASTVGAVGDIVTYTYTAKNTGQTDLDSIDITELTFTGKGTAPDVSACAGEIGALAVGDSGTCTATYLLTAADIASKANIVNTATATGTPPNDPPVTSPPASYTVTVKPPVILAFTGAPQVEQELILVGLFIAFGGALLLTSRAYRRRRNAA